MKYSEIIKNSLTNINFKGRVSRKEYIVFKIFQFLVGLLSIIFFLIPLLLLGYQASVSTGKLPPLNFDIPIDMNVLAIYCLIAFLIFVPVSIWVGISNLCISVKRLHDFNYSGWIYFAYIVVMMALTFVKDSHGITNLISTLACFAEFVIFACIKGTDGENQFDIKPNEIKNLEVQ